MDKSLNIARLLSEAVGFVLTVWLTVQAGSEHSARVTAEANAEASGRK